MVKKRCVRLRISRQRMEALQEICDEMREDFVPTNEHQLLLGEYLQELAHQLRTLLARSQETYVLQLTATEATAFYQLWNMLDISSDKYAALIVGNLLEKISSLAA